MPMKKSTTSLPMSSAAVRSGAGRREIDLPMNLTDLGDFLGLRFETISRTMSKMTRLGMLQRVKGTTDLYLSWRTPLLADPAKAVTSN